MQKHFTTVTGEYLMNTPLTSTPFIVSELIPQGLHILGGAPKIGKSWLMLWLCLQISKGENVWDFATQQGTTLYLCLEDSYERIQSRLFDIADDATASIHFAVMADSVASGLATQIENFVNDYPDTNLIVIDTLQNIREQHDGGNSYADDYTELKILREIASKHKIAILLVHHLRKSKDIDPINLLSGTTGLSGAVDTVFILDRKSRTENIATLYCTGRDIESRELTLEMDDSHIWNLIPDEQSQNKSTEIDDCIKCLVFHFSFSANNFTGTATELSDLLYNAFRKQFAPPVLRKKLLKHHGFLFEHGIKVEFKRTHTDKIICITSTAIIVDVTPAFGASVELPSVSCPKLPYAPYAEDDENATN